MTLINNIPPGMRGPLGLGSSQPPDQPIAPAEALASGALGAGTAAAALGAMSLLQPTGGPDFISRALTPPRGAAEGVSAPSQAGLSAAASKLEDSGTFSLMEVTTLIYQANRQARTVQRNDMVATLDAQAKLSENVASNMKSAAAVRFTAAVTSAVVSAASSFASVKVASNTKISSELATAKSQAYSGVGGALGGMISAAGELGATEYDSKNKLLEASISRMEKNYQESNSMLGDLKENMQLARDTLRALADAQMGTRIAGNF